MVMCADIDKNLYLLTPVKKSCRPSKFGDQGPKSGSLKYFEGPQIFDEKDPNGP